MNTSSWKSRTKNVRLTDEERSWLKAHPEKLTLFFNTQFPPIEFISGSGSFTGMGADVISRIESLLGIDFVKTPLDDWNRHLAALKSGECAIAPTIVRTGERETYAFRRTGNVRVFHQALRHSTGGCHHTPHHIGKNHPG